VEGFEAEQLRAQDALVKAQIGQERSYNEGRLTWEFEVRDLVVLNRDSLRLTRDTKGKGKRLLPKYDSPFEISEKLGRTAYRLRLPVSFRIHPIINVAHLEPYHLDKSGKQDRLKLVGKRGGFEEFPEYEVEGIVDKKWQRLRSGRREKLYRIRYTG
jgi:hypothetical protein